MISTVCWNTLPGRLLTFTTVAAPYLELPRTCRNAAVLFGETDGTASMRAPFRAHGSPQEFTFFDGTACWARCARRARQERKVDIALFGSAKSARETEVRSCNSYHNEVDACPRCARELQFSGTPWASIHLIDKSCSFSPQFRER